MTLSKCFKVINDDDSASRNSIQTADGALCLGVEEDNRYVFYFYVAYKNTLTHVLKHKHIINLDFFLTMPSITIGNTRFVLFEY